MPHEMTIAFLTAKWTTCFAMQTSSLKIEVDPLEVEPVMVQPNPVGASILPKYMMGLMFQ